MQQTEYKQWLKGIVGSVEELEASYKRRIEIMAKEYQRDINDLLAAYKTEKSALTKKITELQAALEKTNDKLMDAVRLFKNERVAHKITKDKLGSSST